MQSILQRIINSLIWIACGALVITIRALILQTSSLLYWEALGFGMIVYGSVKLLWVLVRGTPPTSVP